MIDEYGIARFPWDKGKYDLPVMAQLERARMMWVQLPVDNAESRQMAAKALMDATSRIEQDIRVLIEEALTTDGAHHKQWYLEQIALRLGLNPDRLDHKEGIAP